MALEPVINPDKSVDVFKVTTNEDGEVTRFHLVAQPPFSSKAKAEAFVKKVLSDLDTPEPPAEPIDFVDPDAEPLPGPPADPAA